MGRGQVTCQEGIVNRSVGEHAHGFQGNGIQFLNCITISRHDQVANVRIARLHRPILLIHQTREVGRRNDSDVGVGAPYDMPSSEGGDLEGGEKLVKDGLAGVALAECDACYFFLLDVFCAQVVRGVAGSVRDLSSLLDFVPVHYLLLFFGWEGFVCPRLRTRKGKGLVIC